MNKQFIHIVLLSRRGVAHPDPELLTLDGTPLPTVCLTALPEPRLGMTTTNCQPPLLGHNDNDNTHHNNNYCRVTFP